MKRAAFCRIAGQRAFGDIERADHDREHVVEVVRDAARELSHCFHFLQLPDLSLRRGPRGSLVEEWVPFAASSASVRSRTRFSSSAFKSLRCSCAGCEVLEGRVACCLPPP